MHTPQEIERQFRELHDASTKEYEEQIQQWKKLAEQERERLRADEKEMRDSLKKSSIDLDLLDRRIKRSSDNLQAFLKSARQEQINRPSRRVADFKEHSLDAATTAGSGRQIFPPYASSLMAPDKSYLEGIEGEMGNPWIFPSNPGQIKIKSTDSGDGWGCWATAGPPAPKYTTWYYFIPDQTATWELTAITVFHGFYVLRADDGIFTCKVAKVRTTLELDVLQYYWKGVQTYKLIDISDDDINTSKNYDSTQFNWVHFGLKAGDPVWVKVEVSIDAIASGGGSYAEMNFSDGSANYIEPLFLAAQAL
jgi:hypothetical protein